MCWPRRMPSACITRRWSTLLRIQTRASVDGLADYDQAFLTAEMEMFVEWFIDRHLGITLAASEARRSSTRRFGFSSTPPASNHVVLSIVTITPVISWLPRRSGPGSARLPGRGGGAADLRSGQSAERRVHRVAAGKSGRMETPLSPQSHARTICWTASTTNASHAGSISWGCNGISRYRVFFHGSIIATVNPLTSKTYRRL